MTPTSKQQNCGGYDSAVHGRVDVVRDSRNAVHYGADPAMGNTYEKVASLLMGGRAESSDALQG